MYWKGEGDTTYHTVKPATHLSEGEDSSTIGREKADMTYCACVSYDDISGGMLCN